MDEAELNRRGYVLRERNSQPWVDVVHVATGVVILTGQGRENALSSIEYQFRERDGYGPPIVPDDFTLPVFEALARERLEHSEDHKRSRYLRLLNDIKVVGRSDKGVMMSARVHLLDLPQPEPFDLSSMFDHYPVVTFEVVFRRSRYGFADVLIPQPDGPYTGDEYPEILAMMALAQRSKVPKYTVKRTRHYTLTETLELTAGTDEEAIMEAFSLDRGIPPPVENLAFDDITVEEITKGGEFVYSDHND